MDCEVQQVPHAAKSFCVNDLLGKHRLPASMPMATILGVIPEMPFFTRIAVNILIIFLSTLVFSMGLVNLDYTDIQS